MPSKWPYGTVVRISDRSLTQQSTASIADECAKARVMVVRDPLLAGFLGVVVNESRFHRLGDVRTDWTRSSWQSVDEGER